MAQKRVSSIVSHFFIQIFVSDWLETTRIPHLFLYEVWCDVLLGLKLMNKNQILVWEKLSEAAEIAGFGGTSDFLDAL